MPRQTVAAPPPVVGLHASDVTDHHVWVGFTSSYTVVARLTRGYTPAATPTGGYAMRVGPGVAQSGTGTAVLGADLPYTVALWNRVGSSYSAPRSLTVRTLKDTTPPNDLEIPYAPSTSVGPHAKGQVQLAWDRSNVEEDLAGTRIVRNTAPTTSGGTVFWLPGTPTTWTDYDAPVGPLTAAQPVVHYWLIDRDKAGNYAKHYRRIDVVVASRTISGHIADAHPSVSVLCCPLSGDVYVFRVDQVYGGLGPTAPGSYTLHVPPGAYLVCEQDRDSSGPQTCYGQHPDRSVYSFAYTPSGDADAPPPTLDLRGPTSVSNIDF